MRPFVQLAPVVFLFASCATGPVTEDALVTAPADSGIPAPTEDASSPFAGMAMRYDGYYMEDRGTVLYLIRFYPEGRAVLINGTTDVKDDLPKFLTRDTQGNPGMGLYNVMVDVRSDSLFFVTRPEKGEISYKGNVVGTSLVRLHRHSHITGKDQIMEYEFHPDPPQGPEHPSE